jgi:acyl-CoA thioesterase YciA
MDKKDVQIRVVMMPKDTNAMGNIFGGVILAHLDLAAGEHARKLFPKHRFVTKILREVDFIAPVKVGDAVSCYTETVRVGKTSVTIRVLVEVERRSVIGQGQVSQLKVTEAEVVMVAVDEQGRSVALS